MQFDTYTYALFLPLVFFIYWGLRRHLKWQNLFLLVASYVFYGWWDWRMLCLIILPSVTTWGSAMLMRGDRSRADKTWAALNIVLNLGILCMFKYLNFLRDSLVHFLGLFGVNPDWPTLYILLPVGISFYTFQAISYTVDVYRGEIKPTRDVVAFGVFIAFFPQLVAGPIERATNLLPQFLRTKTFDYETAVVGMRQITDHCRRDGPLCEPVARESLLLLGIEHGVGRHIVRRADLCRLLGLQRHRHRLGPIVEHQAQTQLPLPVLLSQYEGIVAAVAHLADDLVQALCVFPVGRFPSRPLAHGIQHNGGVLALRFVARSRLDVRDMGYCQRPAAVAVHLHAAPSIEATLRELPRCLLTFLIFAAVFLVFRADGITHLGQICDVMMHGSWLAVPQFIEGIYYIVPFFVIEWLGRHQEFPLEQMRMPRVARWLIYWGLLAGIAVASLDYSTQFIYFQF